MKCVESDEGRTICYCYSFNQFESVYDVVLFVAKYCMNVQNGCCKILFLSLF